MTQNKAGTIGLDIKIPENVAEREGSKAGSVIQRSMQRSLQAGPNAFKNVFSGLTKGSRQSAKEVSSISHEMAALETKLEHTNALLEVHRQRLARLKEQYELLSEMGLGGSDRGLKMQKGILDLEGTIARLTQRSDETAKAIWKIEDAMEQAGKASEGASKAIDKSSSRMDGAFTGVAKSATNMANQITYAIKRVLRRVLLFGVMYKALRGFIGYMSSALKTNSQFARSMDIIRTNLKVAFQPIYQYILPAINALARGLATVSTYVASFISALFGKTYKDSFDAAQQLDDARNAMDDYGKAAKKAKSNLMGWDELNILDRSTPDAGVSIPGLTMPDPDIDTAAASERSAELVAILQPTIDSLSRLWEALKPYGQTFGTGLANFWNNILVPFGEWLFEFGIPGALDLITDALTRLSDWAAANPAVVDTMFQLILGSLAGLWVYNTTKKIVNFVGSMTTAFKKWADTISIAGTRALIANVGFALLLGSVLLIAANWHKMNGIEKTIAILGAIAIAAATAAAAIGALQSAWSLGIAAAAIVAGTAAIAVSIASANKRAKESVDIDSYGKYPGMATGGFITGPTLTMVGERHKKEVVLPLEQNTAWADIVADKLASRMGNLGGGSDAPVNAALQVDGVTFARLVAKSLRSLQKQTGKDVIPLGVQNV